MAPSRSARSPVLALLLACAPRAASGSAGAPSLRGSAGAGGAARQERQASSRGNKVFLWVSDPHGDPLYGQAPAGGLGGQQCKKEVSLTRRSRFGSMGCDAPYELVGSAARAAAELSVSPEFVLFTGDFNRHNMESYTDPAANTTETIGGIAEAIVSRFPGVPTVFGTLGNDDAPENYYLNVTTRQSSNPWVETVGETLASSKALGQEVLPEYSYGGYYEMEVGGLTVLTINTLIYSVNHQPNMRPDEAEDPFKQFAWLRARLASATEKGLPVWIMGHIPPGIETYGYKELWAPAYVEKYLGIVQDPKLGVAVAAQLFGHVHADEFRLLPDGPGSSGPVLLTGAISPVYFNNPSFRIVEYEVATGRLVSFKEFWAELPEGNESPAWKFGYDLVESYSQLRTGMGSSSPLGQGSFRELAQKLVEGGEDFDFYAGWYKTQYANDLQSCSEAGGASALSTEQREECRRKYVCALTVWSQQRYDACAAAHASASSSSEQGSLTSHQSDAALLANLRMKRPGSYHQVARLLHWVALSGDGQLGGRVRSLLAAERWDELAEFADEASAAPIAAVLRPSSR